MFLQVNALQVHYPGRQVAAVDSVSLQLQAGQMGVLIGPSGCGKTTLLRAVAGLEKSVRVRSASTAWWSAAMASICRQRSAVLAWCSKTMRCFRI